MTYTEIEASIIGAKSGNRQDMMKILEQYRPFIYKEAQQYKIISYDLNDLVQICYMALIKSITNYRTGSHTFSTYAYITIKNALRYTARQNRKHQNNYSINSLVNSFDNTRIAYVDCIEADEKVDDKILESERAVEINKALSNLPSDEADLVKTVFYKKNSLKSYAQENGLGYLQAVRKKKRILKKLNTNLLS